MVYRLKRVAVDLLTLVRVPVIVLLAVVIDADNADTAAVLLGLGYASHYLDGIVAKWLKVETGPSIKPLSWHSIDTAVLSLGLQIAAAVWLIRGTEWPGEALGWSGILVVYLAVTVIFQTLYVQPAIDAGRKFVPIVLYGSVPAWNVLAALYADRADISVLTVLAALNALIGLHYFLHMEVWNHWRDEAQQGGWANVVLLLFAVSILCSIAAVVIKVVDDNTGSSDEVAQLQAEVAQLQTIENHQEAQLYAVSAHAQVCTTYGNHSDACRDRLGDLQHVSCLHGYTASGYTPPFKEHATDPTHSFYCPILDRQVKLDCS